MLMDEQQVAPGRIRCRGRQPREIEQLYDDVGQVSLLGLRGWRQ